MYWNRYGKKYQVIDSNLAHTDKELERLKNMKKFNSTCLASKPTSRNRRPPRKSKTCSPEEPRDFHHAMKVDKARWTKPILDEFQGLEKRGTWKEVKKEDAGRQIITSRMVLKAKYDSQGKWLKDKARLTAHGFKQIHGIDFNETHTSVARLESIRILLAVSTSLGMAIGQIDIDQAYLKAQLDTPIYMHYPAGYEFATGRKPKPGHCLQLLKGLYGLKQSGRLWNRELLQCLSKHGIHPLISTGDWVRPVRVSNTNTLFDDLYEVHYNICGHKKSEVMQYTLHARFGKSIPRQLVEDFCNTCPVCNRNHNRFQENAVAKPVLSWGFGEVRVQVDLIDFSSKPSNGFKFILNYQDHAKKYVWLEKLTNKQTKTIILCLVKIFSLLGPPRTLHYDNGPEFSSFTKGYGSLKSLQNRYPLMKLKRGKVKHPQSQGGVEASNKQVQRVMHRWLVSRGLSDFDWSQSIEDVNYIINTTNTGSIEIVENYLILS